MGSVPVKGFRNQLRSKPHSEGASPSSDGCALAPKGSPWRTIARVRLRLLLLFALVCLSCRASAPASTSREDAEARAGVRRAFAGLVEAARSLDIDRYLAQLDSEHFTALNDDGTVAHSLAEFEPALRASFGAIASYQTLEFQRVKITPLGTGSALLVNEYTAALTLKDGAEIEARGAGTQVWRDSPDGWKLAHIASSAR